MSDNKEAMQLAVEVTKALAAAFDRHSQAILELAQAIREHAYLTAPDDEDDDENTRAVYMDGTPVQ